MPLTVFVVAASVVARERVRRLVAGAGVQVAGEGVSLAAAATADVDVVIIADGEVHEAWPPKDQEAPAAVVVLSDDAGTVAALREMDLPGWAVLPPDATGDEIRAGGVLAAAGLVVLPAQVIGPTAGIAPPPPDFGEDDGLEPAESLTPREREVLERLAEGLSNREIAAALGISEHTAKFHVASVLGKLGAANRAEAVRQGLRRGLLAL